MAMQGAGTEGPASEPTYGYNDAYGSPPGPRGELRIPLANLPSLVKILLFNLCALGLVFALIVPWVSLDVENNDENVTASYDGKLQRLDTPEEDDGMPQDLRDLLEATGYNNVEEHFDRGLAITGFILLFIILGAAIFLRLLNVLSPRVSGGVQVALVSVALLPACMVTVAGLRFVGGFGIAYDSMLNAFGGKATVASYGGLAVAVVGLFIIALLVLELLRELRATSSMPPGGPWPWSGPFPQKVILGLVVVAMIGIVSVPVSPWVSFDPDDEDMDKFYQDEGLIHGRAEAFDSGSDVLRDARRDIHHVSACFWLALVFGLVAFMAIALVNLGAPKLMWASVMSVGAGAFLFPLLGLLAHVAFMGNAKDLEIAMSEGDVTFTAWAPLVLAFILILVTLLHTAVVARRLRGQSRGATLPIVEDFRNSHEVYDEPGMPVAFVGGGKPPIMAMTEELGEEDLRDGPAGANDEMERGGDTDE
jgi:hypothetical protein